MYKTNIVKRALYLRRGQRKKERERERGPRVFLLCLSLTVYSTPGHYVDPPSLSLFLSRLFTRQAARMMRAYGCGQSAWVQVRNELRRERDREREKGERGARVLRRRPPDADWASRNFRACNYPWSSSSVVQRRTSSRSSPMHSCSLSLCLSVSLSLFLFESTLVLIYQARADWFRARTARLITLVNNWGKTFEDCSRKFSECQVAMDADGFFWGGRGRNRWKLGGDGRWFEGWLFSLGGCFRNLCEVKVVLLECYETTYFEICEIVGLSLGEPRYTLRSRWDIKSLKYERLYDPT